MAVRKSLLAALLLSTMTFGADKSIKAPNGNLVLDAATGSQVKINKQVQVLTNINTYNIAQTNNEGIWNGNLSLTLGSSGGNRQLVSTSFFSNYANITGVACGISLAGYIKDGSTVLATQTFGFGISAGFNNKISYTITAFVPTPAAGNYTIMWADVDGGACAKYWSITSISASSSNLW